MPQFRPLTDFAIEGCFEALSWLNAVLAGTLFAGGYSIAILYWPVGVPLLVLFIGFVWGILYFISAWEECPCKETRLHLWTPSLTYPLAFSK